MSEGKSRSKRRNWKGKSSQKPVHDETRKVGSDGVSRLYLDLERRISNIAVWTEQVIQAASSMYGKWVASSMRNRKWT